MACTLGRAVLPSPDSIRQEGGGKLRIGHSGYPFPVDEGLVMAQQLLGYPNPDEEVVFFTYDAQAANGVLDGAYFVAGTDVDWVKLAAGLFSWSAELVPVPAMQLPTFEVSCLGDDLVNAHALTGVNWVAFPGSALARTAKTGTESSAPLVGGGTVDAFAGAGVFDDVTTTYAVEGGDVYEAAAQLTVEGSLVTGRQTLRTSIGWVVENGLVRVRPSLTAANQFYVGVANSAGTAYDEYAWRLIDFATEAYEYGFDGTTRYGPIGVVVLRNSPECVAIRVVYADSFSNQLDGGGSAAAVSGSLDVTVRRGQPFGDFQFSLDDDDLHTLGVYRATADASASITGGVEDATAVGGIKWQVYTPVARTADNTNGGLWQTASADNLFAFGIGNDRDVYGTASGQPLADFYFAAQEHFQAVASR
jgi:hypothetical protein